MPSDEEPRLHRYPAYVRESPYLEFAIEEGAIMAWPYNRMWLPGSFGRDRRVEYDALLERLHRFAVVGAGPAAKPPHAVADLGDLPPGPRVRAKAHGRILLQGRGGGVRG